MRQVSRSIALLAFGTVAAGGLAALGVPIVSPALAACEGERVDGTTADSARQKIQKAGYTQVRDLKKGCDSVWHGTALKAGAAVRVLVNPQGQVMEEGN